MSESIARLRARRAALLVRGGLQRAELRTHTGRITAAADSADRGLGLVRKFATPPVLVAGGIATALLLGRGRTRQVLAAGLTVLGLVLRLRSTGQLLATLTGSNRRAQAVSRSR